MGLLLHPAALGGVPWERVLWADDVDRLAYPLALLGLLALPVLAWGLLRRRRAGSGAVYPAVHRAAGAPRSLRASTGWLPAALRVLAAALLVVASARPQAASGETRERTEGIAIQLVLDRSSSMDEAMVLDGRQVTRFEAVKEVVAEFIAGSEEAGLKGREGDMIGMIAFAGFADTVAPLVRHHEALLTLLEPLGTAQMRSEDGTNIGDALALAVARLRRAEQEIARTVGDADASRRSSEPEFQIKSKIVVLLTDGRASRTQIDPLTAARLAAEYGVRIYTVGVGGGERYVNYGGLRIPQGSGVDEDLLRSIAEVTGGRFFMASDADALRQIYATIDELETTEIETSELTRYEERFTPFALWGLGLLALEAALRAFIYRRLP